LVYFVWWRDDLNWWRVGGGEMTSPGGEVVGGEATCGGKMVGGEFSWWRDDGYHLCEGGYTYDVRHVLVTQQF